MSSLDFGWAITQQGRLCIRPNTDVASISGVLHLVWPLAQSLSSMVAPTRSQNSSWRSLWDLRGTQAPQLRQSNNTLGGGVAVAIVISTTHEKSCMDSHNARKFEKSSKIQSFKYIAITMMKLWKYHSHEFLKL